MQVGKGEITLCLFTDDTTIYRKAQKLDLKRKIVSENLRNYNKILGSKVNIQKPIVSPNANNA
jgi:hypothetical protein